MKTAVLIFHAFRDLFIRWLPHFRKDDYAFAFLVHPRNIEDTYRKYPFFRHFPESFLLFFLRHFWPVVLSRVTGLKSLKTGKEIKGYIITIPLTAQQMLDDRKLTKRKIIQAIKLGEKLGVRITGLGALISSITKGGLDLINNINSNITTGHAYTAYIVTSNLFNLLDLFKINKNKALVAIVGAAGSIGSTSAQILARAGIKNLLLIDVERKNHFIEDLIPKLAALNKDINIKVSYKIEPVKKADFIITATNVPEAVIKAKDLKSGAIIIDDAQPSDVSPEVFERTDVLVVEGGLVHTSGINNHFNFGLKDKYDNYACFGETMLLATQEWEGHYVVNRANLELVDNIAEYANRVGFRVAEFQNFIEVISEHKLSLIKNIVKKN